ncbi:MAG: hypothetical protein K0S47_4122 [Herbinix sp.]|jgi:hypothetical protein|nr:hypothetical protein [Herbinix sp.]
MNEIKGSYVLLYKSTNGTFFRIVLEIFVLLPWQIYMQSLNYETSGGNLWNEVFN